MKRLHLRSSLALILCAISISSTSPLQAQTSYHVTELLGMQTAYGINDSGAVVGGNALFSGGTLASLPEVYPSLISQTAWDVNNSGVVAGQGGHDYFYGQQQIVGPYQHGFVYNSASSTMTDAGLLPGGLETRLFAINNSGTASGWGYQLNGNFMQQQAVTYSGGTLNNVHDLVRLNPTDAQSAVFGIADNGNLAGFSLSTAGNRQAFRYNGSSSTSLGTFGGANSVALGLNDTATVGWAQNAIGYENAFVHDGTTLKNLTTTFTGSLATKANSAAAAINATGTIVGQAYNNYTINSYTGERYYYGDSQAFVSDGTHSWDLTSLANSANSWSVTSASDINASGQIAATATRTGSSYVSGGYYYYYNNPSPSGVVLTPETAWSAAGNGSWDTGANWAGGAAPGTTGAGLLNLADGVTVTGPSAPTTLYALTVGTTGTAATLALQNGAPLNVTGDVELRGGGIIDATAASLNTFLLHGNGTVLGDITAGNIRTGDRETLSLSGNITAGSTLISDTGILRLSGTLHSAISQSDNYGFRDRGTIQLTGNATLGGSDILSSVRMGTLKVAGFDATLLTGGTASHQFNTVELGGGQVTAATGIGVESGLLGGGTVVGDVRLTGAVVQPGVGNTLTITGNLRGSGLLVGHNISVGGTMTEENLGNAIPSANIGTEDATFFGQGGGYSLGADNVWRPNGYASLGGVLQMNGGTVTAATGLSIGAGGGITGSGVVNGKVLGLGSTVTATGNLTLGDATSPDGVWLGSSYTSHGYYQASLNAGNNTVTLLDAATAFVSGVNLNGGTVVAANGLAAENISGYGTINGSLSGYGSVSATGDLTLGNAASTSGVDFQGKMTVGNHTVTLLDADYAKIGAELYSYHITPQSIQGYSSTLLPGVTLSGGTIVAANGVELYENSYLQASGTAATSTINGNMLIHNSILEATDGNTLAINGTLTGYGALMGNVTTSGLNVTPGDVVLPDFFNLGSRTMTILSQSRAQLGIATTMSGGTITAANGLELNDNLQATGTAATSTINGNLLIHNSILEATDGNSLAINGTLSGYGVLLGNVNATALNATAGDVVLADALNVGARTMTVLSLSRAQLGTTTTLAGGAIGASDGLGLGTGRRITGYGTVNPGAGQSLQLINGILDVTAGQALAVNGNLEGYGIVVGNATVSGVNSLATTPSGSVFLSGTLDVGTRTATLYSSGTATINSGAKLSMAGGNIVAATGIQNAGEISGHGTINGNTVLNSGVLNADDSGMSVVGTLSGKGVLVGTINASANTLASSPSGPVSYAGNIDIGNRVGTVYSSGHSAIQSVTSQGGTLNTGSGGTSLGSYQGYGTLNGDVALSGGIFTVDVGKNLDITGNFTGYGIVVGSHNKGIGNPTGTVDYHSTWSIHRNDIAVYSLAPPKVQEVELQPGARIFSAQGWDFGNLHGNGIVGGNVAISTMLSPGFSPGTIHFENDLTLASGSTTVIEFAGADASQHDFLDVAGKLSLGGSLQVNFLNSYDPGLGQLADWFSASSFEGDWASVSWTGLAADEAVRFDGTSGQFSIVSPSQVPEPTTASLAWLALGLLSLRRTISVQHSNRKAVRK